MRSASAKPAAALAVPLLGLVAWLSGCTSPPVRHIFDPQESRILDQPLSLVEPCVPTALERLGVTVDNQVAGRGKLTIYATSASDLDVTVRLEAMTTNVSQLQVCVAGYATFGDWLASEIADAISDELDKAMERAALGGAEAPR